MEKGIFSLIPEQNLRDVLQTLHDYTTLSIQLINQEGDVLMSFGEATRYCGILKKSIFTNNECFDVHRKAGELAQRQGEAYIFTCHANLNHIAFPIIDQAQLLASVIIGPFLMDKPDSTLLAGIIHFREISPATALELYDELSDIIVIPPARVNHLSRLLDHLLSPLLTEGRKELRQSHEKLDQQSRINETIQMYKEQTAPETHNFLYEKENVLLTKFKTGNVNEAKALLNDLLGYVFFHEGGKLDTVRMRAMELTTLLSRVAMSGGARESSIYELNGKYMSLMNQEQSFESICLLLQDAVVGFMKDMLGPTNGNNQHVKRALQFISTNYSEQLTLDAVANEIGISPAYLSSLLIKHTGVGFREHLTRVRIEEAKLLLLSTNESFADIALALGFTDQSYFNRVFKRIVGLSPGKYRG